MKQLYFILLSLVLLSCSENISELANDDRQASLKQENQTRATVDIHNQSKTNPTLLNDWENVQTISLNTSGNHNVTAPWANGTASSLSESFRKDIKKEDGWVMLFHTFKQKGLDERQNYMLFYNQLTGYIKVFYYYEGERASQGTQWYIKTANGSCSKLFNLTNFLAFPDDVADINMAVFSNQVGDPTKGLQTGWNGFEFEVPYCTDYADKEFILGAYDKLITKYNFLGNVNLNSSGTITPMGGISGWQSTVANLAGQGAKSLIDDNLKKSRKTGNNTKNDSTGTFGQKLADLVSKIPAGNYAQAISAGLSLIFGKTTVTNNYDVKLTTTGKVEFNGTGTTEMTSGIPSVTFNLYSLMNSEQNKNITSSFVYNLAEGNGHYVGVWSLQTLPKVCFRRITLIDNPTNWQLYSDGSIYISYVKVKAPGYWTNHTLVVNPDLKELGTFKSAFSGLMRCDSLSGKVYSPKMIDIGDYLHSSLAYQDKEKCLYNLDGYIETSYKLSSSERYNKREFYFDWGNIDCGRQVIVIKCNNKISYKGKTFDIQQTRSYPASYHIDLGVVEDVPYYNEGRRKIVNGEEPFYEYKKWRNGIPIIDYE